MGAILKNFQVRVSDELHTQLNELAKERSRSMADILRESIEIYTLLYNFSKEGHKLYTENPDSTERKEIIIPSLFHLRK